MKKLKILANVLRHTSADKILFTYLIFVLIDALVIFLFDPGIESYGDSLWYCCVVIATVGFGDLVVTTLVARIATVLLMLYSVIVVAIVTGVVVNFYTQLVSLRQNDTVAAFVNKLENLPDLSKDELRDLSEKVKQFKNK